jgi:hypothetical protein
VVHVKRVVVAVATALVLPGTARAAVSLGGLDPTPRDAKAQCGYGTTLYVEGAGSANSTPAAPARHSRYVVPAGGGTITSWSVSQQKGGSQVRLAVVSFSPGAKSLQVDALSRLQAIPASAALRSGVETFPARVRVKGGEEIALDEYSGAPYSGCAFPGLPGEQIDIADDGQDGGGHRFGNHTEIPAYEVNVEATLRPSGHRRHKVTGAHPGLAGGLRRAVAAVFYVIGGAVARVA